MILVLGVQVGGGGGWFQFAMFLRFICVASCRNNLFFSFVVHYLLFDYTVYLPIILLMDILVVSSFCIIGNMLL